MEHLYEKALESAAYIKAHTAKHPKVAVVLGSGLGNLTAGFTDTEELPYKALTIERQGHGLLTLINQLLDISKLQSSVGNADWRNGNITAYLTMIVESWRDYARSRNIDLQFLAKDTVEMDFVPDYVNKVVNNLLSNAFKFTPEYGCGHSRANFQLSS